LILNELIVLKLQNISVLNAALISVLIH